MVIQGLEFVFTLGWAVIYLFFASFVMRQRSPDQHSSRWLVAYSAAAAAWQVLGFIQLAGLFEALEQVRFPVLQAFGALVMAGLFMGCTFAFLRVRWQGLVWLGVAAAWLLLLVSLYMGLLVFPVIPSLQPDSLLSNMIILGWVIDLGVVIFYTGKVMFASRQPMHRNRLIYWGLALLATSLADLFFVVGEGNAGSMLRLVGVLIVGYAIFIHNLLDLQWTLLRLVNFLVTALLGLVVYVLVLIFQPPLPENSFLGNEVVQLGVKAAFLFVLVNPALNWFDRYVRGLIFGFQYDQSSVVREYSLRISNILDMQRLADTALDVMRRSMGITKGRLFVVDSQPQEHQYVLRPVPRPDEPEYQLDAAGHIQEDSPVVAHFCQMHRPLMQYDLDFSTEFREADKYELRWLNGLDSELFVPVCTQDSWIGLFALGSKISGARFFAEDVNLLTTLADQTVVALENARLFTDLTRLNEELQRTTRALEEANVQLRQVDEVKSAFIGVVTHEMRTPLANIGFSLQVLEMYLKDQLNPQQKEQMEEVGKGVQTARVMVDNLIMLAAFLNDQAKMNLSKLDFTEVLRQALTPYKGSAEKRSIKLQLDLIGDLMPVYGDRALLVNATSQLVNNAIKFTPENGSVQISCWTSTDALCLDVRDTGVGIPEGKLSRVWDAFTQLSSDPLKRGMEGLGLGLALVRFIVHAHGGHVWVESQEGQGSVFGFRIPLAGPERPLSPREAEQTQARFRSPRN